MNPEKGPDFMLDIPSNGAGTAPGSRLMTVRKIENRRAKTGSAAELKPDFRGRTK
jgi:hypothetical protein